MNKLEKTIFDAAEPIAGLHGCELADVEFVREGAHYFLRVYIDKEEGVQISDCELVSKALSKRLDELDPIEQSYFLEVSSPGLDRPLKTDKDFLRFMGSKVELKLYKAVDKKKLIVGVLCGYDGNIIKIEENDGEIKEIEKEKAAYVRLYVEF